MTGKLLACIISTDKKARVVIAFDEVPEVVVYDFMEFTGTKYCPIKISSVDSGGEKFNFHPDCFYINNKLRILAEGSIGTSVKITLRYI